MSIVTMDMSSFEIERNHSIAEGNEVMCAGWNPALALHHPSANSKPDLLPPDMIAVDTEAFLQRMYAYQQH